MRLFVDDYLAARRRVVVQLILASDGVSPATAEAGGSCTISKNGATPAAANGTLVAVDSAKGIYYLECSAAELSDLGKVTIIYDSANTVPFEATVEVVPLEDLHSGTCQAGAVGSATLASDASAIDDAYNNAIIYCYAGTGKGQMRTIGDYNGTTKVATPTVNFGTALDNTSKYAILPAPSGVNDVNVLSISGSSSAADAVEANIGNLDASVASRLASSSYTAPPSAATIRAEIDSNSTQFTAVLSAIADNPTAAEIVTELFGSSLNGAVTAATVKEALICALMLFSISGSTLSIKQPDGTIINTRSLTRAELDAIVASE